MKVHRRISKEESKKLLRLAPYLTLDGLKDDAPDDVKKIYAQIRESCKQKVL